MYPISTDENELIFDIYLRNICQNKKVLPSGRLGLFKYLDMDKAIEVSFEMSELAEKYLNLTAKERYEEIIKIRNKY
jgi:UDP-galactopyranose mutase